MIYSCSEKKITMCISKKYPYPPERKVDGNSEGVGDGGVKSQDFKGKVWNFTGISRGVGSFKPKKTSVRGVWIFLEQHNC